MPALALSVAGVMFQTMPAFADPSTEKPPLTVSGGAKSAKGTDQSACLFGNESGCEGTGAEIGRASCRERV